MYVRRQCRWKTGVDYQYQQVEKLLHEADGISGQNMRKLSVDVFEASTGSSNTSIDKEAKSFFLGRCNLC